MTETSAAGARWRPRVRVVVVDPVMSAEALVLGTLVSALFAGITIASFPDPPTARAVAAMVREDAREAIETLKREAAPELQWSDGVHHGEPIDIFQYPEFVIHNNSDIAADVVDTSPFTLRANGDSGIVLLRVDADGNLLLRGKVKEGVR